MHRCNKCHLEFQKKRTLEQHIQYIHKSDFPSVKKILILGGGFGGVGGIGALIGFAAVGILM